MKIFRAKFTIIKRKVIGTKAFSPLLSYGKEERF